MVVFTFEAQVALHVDIDLGQGSVQVLSDLVDVFLNEEKLPVGFCETALIFLNLRYGEFRYGDSCNIKAGNQITWHECSSKSQKRNQSPYQWSAY